MSDSLEENPWIARRAEQVSREGDHRSPFQRDRARILHSAAFRRLQAKTQVQSIDIDDFFRTRLTHSLEVAQVGSGICAQLKQKFSDLAEQCCLDEALIESLCLAHDIGHPPFGHGGEVALHYMMRDFGGFEGNAQTFRIVTQLEKYSKNHGMDLTRRAILGLVKYPNTIEALTNEHKPKILLNSNRQLKASLWHPPKGIYLDDNPIFEWVLQPLSYSDKNHFTAIKRSDDQPDKHHKTQYKSFDCSIMELADDIAYGIHDFEDAIEKKLVTRDEYENEIAAYVAANNCRWLESLNETFQCDLFSGEHHKRKGAIGGFVNAFITAIVIQSLNENFENPLLKFNAVLPPEQDNALRFFKIFVWKHVIKQPEIQRLEYRGQQMIMDIFEALSSDPKRFLPQNTRERWQQATSDRQQQRVICDYIAGMTDKYAARMYKELFNH